MSRRGWILSVAVLSTLVLAGPAGAALSIPWWTIDAGGVTETTGGTLRLGGTIGQPDAGVSTGGSLVLLGGFWMGGDVASSVPPPHGEVVPALAFRVSAGTPSPFATETRLRLDLPDARFVRARAYDTTGRLVRQLCAGVLPSGSHDLRWDGRGDQGRRLPSGVYLMRVEAGADRATRRLVLLSR